MEDWIILDTGVQSAQENMRLDAELLERADTFAAPVLHLYEWTEESATYGYFTDPAQLLNLEKAKAFSLQLARRPTGGGIIFHLWDMAFSVVVPASCSEFSTNTLENYAFVNRAVLAAVEEFLGTAPALSLTPDDFAPWDQASSHFCMAKPTKYDVMWQGKKVAGAAQRKTKKGFLHQGSIALLMPPPDYLSEILLPGTEVKAAMQAHTYPLLSDRASSVEIRQAKDRLRELLSTHLRHASLLLSQK